MLENQSFQSLLQLAVAMNIGFAALATIYGNSIAKELRSTESLFETTRSYRDEAIRTGSYDDKARAIFKRALELRADVVSENSSFEAFLFGTARTVALLSAVAAYVLLFWATFFGREPAAPYIVVGGIVCNGTFLVCVGYCYFRSVVYAKPLKDRRHSLDSEVSAGLLGLMSVATSEEDFANTSRGTTPA